MRGQEEGQRAPWAPRRAPKEKENNDVDAHFVSLAEVLY